MVSMLFAESHIAEMKIADRDRRTTFGDLYFGDFHIGDLCFVDIHFGDFTFR
jgi:hypothetical protein